MRSGIDQNWNSGTSGARAVEAKLDSMLVAIDKPDAGLLTPIDGNPEQRSSLGKTADFTVAVTVTSVPSRA